QGNYYVQEENTFFGGLIAGANFCQIDGDNYKGYNKTGLNLGAVVYTRVNTDLVASLEILYTQKGSYGKEIRTFEGIAISDYHADLTYAEVPVLLHYFFPSKNYIGAGASFARLVTSDERGKTVPDQKFDQTQYPFRKYAVDFVLDGHIRVW